MVSSGVTAIRDNARYTEVMSGKMAKTSIRSRAGKSRASRAEFS
jgi:hypothetical protein